MWKNIKTDVCAGRAAGDGGDGQFPGLSAGGRPGRGPRPQPEAAGGPGPQGGGGEVHGLARHRQPRRQVCGTRQL